MDGKSDRLDAEQIARAVLGHTSTATPKAKSGIVEVIRTLRVTRASAVKARTAAFNTLWGVMIGAPSPMRDELVVLTKRTLVNRCLRLRPETDDLLTLTADVDTDPDRLLMAGVKFSLRNLARRWKVLDNEIKTLNQQLEALVHATAPQLLQLHGVGTEIAGQFLVTAGDTLIESTARPGSPSSAASPHNPPAADAPAAGTDSVAAETGPLTAPCTSSPSSGSATINPPVTTCNAAPPTG
jgi:transposase